MIRLYYIGTGEAFDDRLPNTSLLYEGNGRVLIDCGYSVPRAYWGLGLSHDALDGIYLSHFHADHCFGLPPLLARMGQDGRRRSLTILGGPGSAEASRRVLELGYPGMLKKLPFPLEWHEFSPGKSELWKQATWTVAQSLHRMPNFSVRIEEAGHAVCYSGDGAPSDATEALYRGASLLIHEAYYDAPQRSQSHASVPGVLELSQRCAVKTLHVLHRKRSLLRPVNVHVPAPGDVVELR